MGIVRVTLIVFSMASILVLAGFSIILNEKAYAGGPPPGPPFGDFVCWINIQATAPTITGQNAAPLRIQDQFGDPFRNVDGWTQIEYCTAAEKNGEPSPFSPFGLAQHYQGWLYPPGRDGPGTSVPLIIDVPQFNQKFQTTLGELDSILVPATKFVPGGQIPSFDTQQHWNCYLMNGPPPDFPFFDLRTQHGDIFQVDVLEPFLFCAPMIKTPLSGPDAGFPFGSNTLEEHMICYDILAGDDQSTNLPTFLVDQLTFFTTGPVPFDIDFLSTEHPQGLEKLCVPAFKSFPAIGGTLIPLDTTALLLAGVQSISMWMIPVVIAGVAIGVFVIKRRK